MKNVFILGAGPAGLATAFELARNGRRVEVIEKNSEVGGLSRSMELKGCKFDIGPHIFIKRNKRIIDFWKLIGQGDVFEVTENSAQYQNGKVYGSFTDIFLHMPLTERVEIVASFLKRRLFPTRDTVSWEEEMMNACGEKMYSIFHETYSRKFWGLNLSKIDKKSANNMVKKITFGLLAKKAILRWLQSKGLVKRESCSGGHVFFHHKYGSGFIYDNLKKLAQKTGKAKFRLNSEIVRINHDGKKITSIDAKNSKGVVRNYKASEFISTIPLTVFVQIMNPKPPKEVVHAAGKLLFRRAVMVNLVVEGNPFEKQWLQVISNDIKAYRITNFRNLSKHMGNGNLCPIGVEYNCFEEDEIWKMNEEELVELARKEMDSAGLIKKENVVDASVLKLDFVYPVYFVGYEKFVSTITDYLSKFENLQCISRSSIYRYNNMGHAVESGFVAADNLTGKVESVEKLNVLDGKEDI